MIGDYNSISDKALEASFAVAQLVAKHKQSHTTAEKFVIPCCQEIVRITIGESALKKIEKVPLSVSTVSWRIDDVAVDVFAQLQDKLTQSKVSALQLDKSTNITKKANCLLISDTFKVTAYKKVLSAEKFLL